MKKALLSLIAVLLFPFSAMAEVPAEVSEQTAFMLEMGVMVAGGVLVAYFAITGLRAIRAAI